MVRLEAPAEKFVGPSVCCTVYGTPRVSSVTSPNATRRISQPSSTLVLVRKRALFGTTLLKRKAQTSKGLSSLDYPRCVEMTH